MRIARAGEDTDEFRSMDRDPISGSVYRDLGGGMGIQGAQERIRTPVPSDDDEGIPYDQARLVRLFRKGGRPSTALGLGTTNLKALKG
jgi:hypothetical protein